MHNRVAVLGVALVVGWMPLGVAATAQERPAGRSGAQEGPPPPRPGGGIAQPGASQGAPTTAADPVKKFDMDYFVGEWQFEGTLAETPLGPGGPASGTERVANVQDGRFWEITIKGEGETPSGRALMAYQDSFAGQSFMRYEVLGNVALLKTGSLGCDLGGVCNMYFESPPFEAQGMRLQVRGRYYLTSPVSYRMSMEISVDKGPFTNVGTTIYTKNQSVKVPVVK